jgi:peroxiredoxin
MKITRRAVLTNAAWVLAFIVVFVGVRWWQTRDMPSGPAPAFTATTLSGKTVTMGESGGKPTLLYFWGSWCPICRMEQGSIDAIAEDHRVITIALEDAESALAHVREHRLKFDVVADESGELSRRYGVRGVPTTIVVDRNGLIRFVEVGYTTQAGLRARLWWAARF